MLRQERNLGRVMKRSGEERRPLYVKEKKERAELGAEKCLGNRELGKTGRKSTKKSSRRGRTISKTWGDGEGGGEGGDLAAN